MNTHQLILPLSLDRGKRILFNRPITITMVIDLYQYILGNKLLKRQNLSLTVQ